MQTLLVWTGGFAGLAAFIVCTVGAVIAIAAHALGLATWLAVLAVAGLGGAVAANRWIAQDRRNRNARRLQAAAAWSGTEIVASLRWARWCFGFGMAAGAGVAGVLLALSSKLPLVALGTLLAVLMLVGVLGLLRLAFAAAAAGYVLRLDPLGVHHCRMESLAWRDVLAVDLKKVQVNNQTSYFLVMALRLAAVPGGHRSVFGRLDWTRPRPAGSNLEIPLAFAAADPDVIAQAARVIGGRAGIPLATGWFHGSDVSLALQRSDALQDWSGAMNRSFDEAKALLQRAKDGTLRPEDMQQAQRRLQQADANAGQAQARLRDLNATFLQEQQRRLRSASRVLYAAVAALLAFSGYTLWTKVHP